MKIFTRIQKKVPQQRESQDYINGKNERIETTLKNAYTILPMRKKEKEAEEEQCFRIPEVT
jgi:hypothetical protein